MFANWFGANGSIEGLTARVSKMDGKLYGLSTKSSANAGKSGLGVVVRNCCAKPNEWVVSGWNLDRELVVLGVEALIAEAGPCYVV